MGPETNRLLTKERSRTSKTRYHRRTNNWHTKFSHKMEPDKKKYLLSLGYRAVDHFQQEGETNPEVSEDFTRMFRLKLSHLCLGIGLFGDYLNT
jgi:hypothetical protein